MILQTETWLEKLFVYDTTKRDVAKKTFLFVYDTTNRDVARKTFFVCL